MILTIFALSQLMAQPRSQHHSSRPSIRQVKSDSPAQPQHRQGPICPECGGVGRMESGCFVCPHCFYSPCD